MNFLQRFQVSGVGRGSISRGIFLLRVEKSAVLPETFMERKKPQVLRSLTGIKSFFLDSSDSLVRGYAYMKLHAGQGSWACGKPPNRYGKNPGRCLRFRCQWSDSGTVVVVVIVLETNAIRTRTARIV